jgi:hypothetical protein
MADRRLGLQRRRSVPLAAMLMAIAGLVAAGCGGTGDIRIDGKSGRTTTTAPNDDGSGESDHADGAGGDGADDEAGDDAGPLPAALTAIEALGLDCEVNISADDTTIYDVGFALRGNLGHQKERGLMTDEQAAAITSQVLSRYSASDDATQYLCTAPGGGFDLDAAFGSALDDLNKLETLDPSDPEYQRIIEESTRQSEELNKAIKEALENPGADGTPDFSDILEHVGGITPSAPAQDNWVGPVAHVTVVNGQVAWLTPSGDWSPEQSSALATIVAENGIIQF